MGILRSSVGKLRRALSLSLDPLRFRQAMIRRSKSSSLQDQVAYDVLPRPHFAYGVLRAAEQAKALGIGRISVLEFGCAGGSGLVALESLADAVESEVGIKIDIYGFDLGEGLPRPLDYRDLPYAWQAGQFKMDIPKLRERLLRTELVIGDVAETVESFRSRENLAPIGFVSFDLDFYTSTLAALRVFDGGHGSVLPRVYCYFDDCIGPDDELHSEYAGELLAIKEWNGEAAARKLAPIHGLRFKRIFPAAWNDVMYILHSFEHRLYGQYISRAVDMQLPLLDGKAPSARS